MAWNLLSSGEEMVLKQSYAQIVEIVFIFIDSGTNLSGAYS
jgi:hypothetical protein